MSSAASGSDAAARMSADLDRAVGVGGAEGHAGELRLVGRTRDQAGMNEDLAAGHGERIDRVLVDDEEVEAVLPVMGMRRDALADVIMSAELYMHSAVEVISYDDIDRAAERIGDRIRRTPVIAHGPLTLKLELMQHAGSFKTRGALNRVLGETDLPEIDVQKPIYRV